MLALAYLTVAQADAYHAPRLTADKWLDLDDVEKSARLLAASDFVDTALAFSGSKTSPTQLRQFPRNGDVAVPSEIKAAVCELAMLDNLASMPERAVKLKSTGGLLMKSGDCDDCDTDKMPLNLHIALRLLEPFRRRSVRLERG